MVYMVLIFVSVNMTYSDKLLIFLKMDTVDSSEI